jgi:hypothetical protein
MGETLLVVILKFGGYALVARALCKLAVAIKDLKSNDDQEPELNEIIKKPRLRR